MLAADTFLLGRRTYELLERPGAPTGVSPRSSVRVCLYQIATDERLQPVPDALVACMAVIRDVSVLTSGRNGRISVFADPGLVEKLGRSLRHRTCR
ncbi:hypothetical protein [Allokutzneria albata]|uniref:Uncharacterized protein n=1 Tax=Allokutzneria albata TaxID=211114 RepID=A0A1G9U8S1_ALLAB|nr:hypothetical protein [Allokutzneria albata]SDM56232.1 hypothetical protein SAMN04489726_2260 [Allokutzneria albata]